MIPDDVINQIRDAVDIVAVIGQHVQLKKAGTSWKGLCPFHGEKSPSFNVSPMKKRFHCFGCQKGGDAIGFLMELEGKSFVEVAEQLAARYNIDVPKIEESPELRRARGERTAMLDMNKVATAFFREMLAHPEHGKPGRAYLAKRAVADEVSEKFQLGYAPAEWGLLADHLAAKNLDMQIAVRLGLVAPRPRGGFYDRFRDRLVCPVMVPGGEVVGFSARIVGVPQKAPDGSEPPKYVNSPESTVYKKSKLLFGLAQAREEMGKLKRAVLVEGNFDVISLHQAGFGEVVAPLGTALTIEQVIQLKRLTERIVLLYDGDKAGYKATMHALQMCVEADVEVLVAWRPGNAKSGGSGQLTDGVDPDSLVAGGGAEQLRLALDNAKGGIDFFAYEVWGRARGSSEARARAVEEAARLIAKVGVPVRRALFVDTLAKALDVDVGIVLGAVARASSSSARGPQAGRGPQGSSNSNNGGYNGGGNGGRGGGGGGGGGYGGSGHPNAPDGDSGHGDVHGDRQGGDHRTDGSPKAAAAQAPSIPEELELLALVLDNPDLIANPEADKAFWLLTDARLRDMYSAARGGQSLVDLVGSSLPSKAAQLVMSGKYVDEKDPKGTLNNMARNLENRKARLDAMALRKNLRNSEQHRDVEQTRLLAQLAMAERNNDHEQVARLTAQISSNRKQVD